MCIHIHPYTYVYMYIYIYIYTQLYYYYYIIVYYVVFHTVSSHDFDFQIYIRGSQIPEPLLTFTSSRPSQVQIFQGLSLFQPPGG